MNKCYNKEVANFFLPSKNQNRHIHLWCLLEKGTILRGVRFDPVTS